MPLTNHIDKSLAQPRQNVVWSLLSARTDLPRLLGRKGKGGTETELEFANVGQCVSGADGMHGASECAFERLNLLFVRKVKCAACCGW